MMKSRTNEDLIASRKRHFVPTATLYYKEPLQLVRAKGVYVWDEKDRRYLDAIGGIVSISAGHNHPRIKQACLEMLEQDQIQHTSVLYLSQYPVELAENLSREAPAGLSRVMMTNSGSEANEFAFLAARHATGETIVMSLRHGYHGGTSGALAQCGHQNWRYRAQPSSATTTALEPYCYRCPFGKKPESCALECARNVETTIQTTTHGKIAAFIAEPIMGVGGFIDPPKEYFHEVARIIHSYGGKYISDEVQTGVGRCGGSFFLTKDLGVDADVVTMAKGLGNGAAIGAALLKEELVEGMAGRFHFNTFGGDPFQAMQACLNLDIVREERLIENACATGERLKDGLKQMMKRHSLIGDVRGRGLLVGFELVKDRTTKEHATAETTRLMEFCKEEGLLVGKGGLFGNVIRLAPPLSITRDEIDFILGAIDRSLHQVENGK
ncbi:MAG: aspartate aminotransferase family protein [Deltaproteobacteria bacterium]|nr:aspartate aminotransferase family protein [Deltaproteobacteria bacterium]